MRHLLLAVLLAGPAQAGIISGGGPTDALSAATAAGTYVQKAGDTMTGRLTAPDATLTYGLTAATASISGSLTASSGTIQNGFNVAGATFTVAATGIVSAPSQPGARGYLTGSQAIPSGSVTEIYFGGESYDRQNMHSNTVSSSAFTVPATGGGLYFTCGQVRWESGTTGARHIVVINVNGTDVSTAESAATTVTESMTTNACDILNLSAGDVVKLRAYQNATATQNVLGGEGNSFLTVIKLW